MASSSTPKAPCAGCGSKGIGIFKCEGCGQAFCRKHVIEHRDTLSHDLDEIIVEYDTLQQAMLENKDAPNHHHHPLIKQIDKWEEDSIAKIQETANETRQQVYALIGSSDGKQSKGLHELAERLRKAREDDDYIETDLKTWSAELEKLKCEVNTASPVALICEDSKKVLVSRISVTVIKKILPEEEEFGEVYRTVRIEDNGRVALHSGSNSCIAYVRGKREYSKGKHQIRFTMKKRTAAYVSSFNIAPTVLAISSSPSDEQYYAYGWETDDGLIIPYSDRQPTKDIADLLGETTFELRMTIDCDNRKISYFNERTKNTHEMNVNIRLCPLPWQLEFYLFDVGDRVELLSSRPVS